MIGFLQFLAAVTGLIAVVAGLGMGLMPGVGLLTGAVTAISGLSVAGLLGGIAGIMTRQEAQTRVLQSIFSALDEGMLKPIEARQAAEAEVASKSQPTPTEPPELTAARARAAELRAKRDGRYPDGEEEEAMALVARLEFAEEHARAAAGPAAKEPRSG